MVDDEREILIVTGMSGAGRSTAADALEDLGWYVVDNLPPQMLRLLVDLAGRAESGLSRIAAVVDIRGRDFFGELQSILQTLRDGFNVRVLFLDASDAALVRRFEAVRRPHPLQADGTILDGITAERSRLTVLRESADVIFDTSDLNVHQLARLVNETFSEQWQPVLRLTVLSFGFKYGLPPDADLVADARFLPNPFWEPALRDRTGIEPEVADFVLSQPGAREFVDRYAAALEPVLTGYQAENKRHVTLAVGCTGGKHRSVVLTRALADRLASSGAISVHVRDRDLGRE